MLGVNATVGSEGSEPPQIWEMERVNSKEEAMECEVYSDVVQDDADDVVQDGVNVTGHHDWPNQDWDYEVEDKQACVEGKLVLCVMFWKEIIQTPLYV